MGNCDCQMKFEEESKISRSDFKQLYPIGKGGFGRVWKVEFRRDDQKIIYAMKQMSKAKIYIKKSIEFIIQELNYLSYLNHPFLSNIHYAFQDYSNLYIVMDYLPRGDLRYHICRMKQFTEEQTKFVIACLVISLGYIHSNKIIHRDLKPENLVFDKKGYLHLTDFGISKEYHSGENYIDSSGTPGYMAPEVIMNKTHDYCVDFFAMGVIAFELMMGKRPYSGKNRKEIKEEMITHEIRLKQNHLPNEWNISALDFINCLMKRKKAERLGFNGIKEIKEHKWIKDLNWERINSMEYPSPFNLPKGDNFDYQYANKKDEIDESNKEYHLHKINSQNYFKNFYYEENMQSNRGTSRTMKSSNFESSAVNHINKKSTAGSSTDIRKKKITPIRIRRKLSDQMVKDN